MKKPQKRAAHGRSVLYRAHRYLTAAAARGEDGAELGRDVGEYDEQEQAFFARDSRNPWHAVWGAQTGCRVLQADLPQSVYGFGNTQGKGRERPPALPPAPRRERAGDHAAVHRGRLSLPPKAEEALALLRGQAETMLEEKRARIEAMKALERRDAARRRAGAVRQLGEALRRLDASHPCRAADARCAAICRKTRAVRRGLGEGDGGAAAAGRRGARAGETLRTLVDVSAQAQLAPAAWRAACPSGKVLQAGGERESAQFVALVHHTLLWSGDKAFAADMLPMTGLCVNYLRRSTRGFEDVQEDMLAQVRAGARRPRVCFEADGRGRRGDAGACSKPPGQPEQGRNRAERDAGRARRAGTASMTPCRAGDRLSGADGRLRRAGSAGSVRTRTPRRRAASGARRRRDDPAGV